MDAIKSKENSTTLDKFAIDELGGYINLIRYYHKVPTINELPKSLMKHTVINSHLNYRSTSDYIQDTLNWYLTNIYSDYEDFVNI